MVRPNSTEVNKEKERSERHDKEDDEVEEQQKFEQILKHDIPLQTEEAAVDNRHKVQTEKPLVLADKNTDKPGVVFVLENAFLEVGKIEQSYQLLNSYDHGTFLINTTRVHSAFYRPDITHQALLMILDSPVNKSGRLKTIYVSTSKGILFEVKPHARIPRTYKRFAGLMVELLQKLSISAVGGSGEKLLRVIKNPVTDHLPVNSKKIGLSSTANKLVNVHNQYSAKFCTDTDLVFVLGSMEHGRVENHNYLDDYVSISRYKLSTTCCISRICEALSTIEEDNDEDKEIIEEGAEINYRDQTRVDIDGRLPGVIFVLEKASLEVAKVGKTYQLLNSSDHAAFLRKSNRNPADYRPDITHQALLTILDSPLNKAGRVKALYVRTETGVLFEVKTHTPLPRIYKKFTEVMLQLLQSLIVTDDGCLERLRVIKNPVTDHLPANSMKIGFSFSSENLVNMQKHCFDICNNSDTVFVVSVAACGELDVDYVDDVVSISESPLTAAYCISRICESFSSKWNII